MNAARVISTHSPVTSRLGPHACQAKSHVLCRRQSCSKSAQEALMNKGLVASIIALTMGVGGAVAAAQSQSVGDAMKNSGRATVNAGKTVTHSVTHTTKKVVGTTGTQTKHRTTVTKTKTVRPTRTVAGTSG